MSLEKQSRINVLLKTMKENAVDRNLNKAHNAVATARSQSVSPEVITQKSVKKQKSV